MITPGASIGALEVIAGLGAGGQGAVFLARPWSEGAARRVASRLLLRARLKAAPFTVGQLLVVHQATWRGVKGEVSGRAKPFPALLWPNSSAVSTLDGHAHGAQRRDANGGMGEPGSPIFTSGRRLAALKLAHPGMADSLHDEHEILAASGVGHPHLACLYGSRFPGLPGPDLGFAQVEGDRQPRLFLALAFEAGVPLNQLLARWGGWRPASGWAIAVAAQVAQALDHLHVRGVVHHDLRPANLIIRPGPHAVLVDLGAAETVGAPRRRAVYGAAGWLPPERLATRPAPASPMVDIYGLGLLLRALTAPVDRPPGLTRLIDSALAPDPGRRQLAFPSAQVLAERLEELLEEARCDLSVS